VKENNNNAAEEAPENAISCSDCVDKIGGISESNQSSITKKILLGSKIREVNITYENYVYTLSIDNKTITTISPLSYLSSIYVLRNEVIMVVTGGSDIRSTQYAFYNSDLQEISVDMTLDPEYPISMVGYDASEKTIIVENDEIIITGTRITHNKDIVNDINSASTTQLCQYDQTTKKSSLISAAYNQYKGAVVKAKYKIKYLGNNQFSKSQRIEVLETVDESYCDF
ncbi:MAG: hypothetical protein PUB18_00090, partial [bacterium]|nr:hypothetical protein [bacterium]